MAIPSMSACGHLLHQLAVLERAWLGLVGVAHEVLGHVAVGQERDLAPHLEAGAAAAADARLHDLRQHVLGGHAQRPPQHVVAAAALVDLQRVQARLVDAVEEDRLHVSLSSLPGNSRGALGPGRSAATSASVRPAVSARWGWSGAENSVGIPPGGGVRGAAVAQLLVREHGAPGVEVLDDPLGVGELQRADVLAVDRGHRPDVAGAQALERAHVDVLALGRRRHRVVELVGAQDRAGDVRAHEYVVGVLGVQLEHVVEARHRGQVGGGEAHDGGDLVDRLRGAPAVHGLGGVQRGDRRRAAVRVLGHRRLDLAAQVLGDRRRRRVGDDRGILGEVDGVVPARHAGAVGEARHATRKRPERFAVLAVALRQLVIEVWRASIAEAHRSIPPRMGSSIARVAMRSAM